MMILTNPPSFLIRTILFLGSLFILFLIYYLINIGNSYIPEKKRIKINNKSILAILGIIMLIYFVHSILKKYTLLSDTFFTIIISMILAYAFNPVVNYFERKGINRLLGVLFLYSIILGVFFLLAFLVIPRSSAEIKVLIASLPKYLEQASDLIDGLYNRYYYLLGDLPPMFQGVQEIVMENLVGFESIIINSLRNFIGGVFNTFSKVVSLVLTPILTLYFLVDKNYFKENFEKLIPRKYKEETKNLFRDIDKALSQFVRGRLILAVYVGIATSILLIIMNIEFALVIGFITMIGDVIPYIGPFIGFLPGFFFALLSSPMKALWMSIFFILIQWVENNVLAPKIIGDTTGMHPIIVLLSIIVGGSVFGVLGMILAVPLVAILKILTVFFYGKFKRSRRI